ncbi:DUF2786 domain-containing protein [Gallibacterium sp. AGMB14963]|uniref:DUF2786 domain-containing protein n=1 Tax=Gallibacterium faecale TaxID=3019086 RepID=UPI0022F15B1E|nr:DUF2786 domain-containing protein [Gallibacterium sp. AGMB14963]MDA3978460.1 DUF2786 domain-containing protein [Gallibacterium sp. AGMB14963]
MSDKILKKIKKLLALSKSTNPHEAAKALEMAQKLMAEHQIDYVDVEVSSIHNKKKFAMNTALYVLMLAGLLRKAFGVEAYVSNCYDNSSKWGEKQCHVVFYGVEEKPIIASYCFDVLYRQLQSARKAFYAKQNKRLKRSTLIARADAFCEGWVLGVSKNVQQFVASEKENNLMTAYKERMEAERTFGTHSGRECGNTKEKGDNSRWLGFEEGKKVELHHGVNGQELKKLGAQ